MIAFLASTDGRRWSLRSLVPDDREALYRWRNDAAIRSTMIGGIPIALAEHDAWFDRVRTSDQDLVTVFELDGEPAGVISLARVDLVHRHARWGFYLRPGAPLPPGSGSRMGFLLLRHAFDELELHRVYADVVCSNERSLGMHRKLGFTHEGIQREHVRRGESWDDVVLFGMLRAEFDAARSALERKLFG